MLFTGLAFVILPAMLCVLLFRDNVEDEARVTKSPAKTALAEGAQTETFGAGWKSELNMPVSPPSEGHDGHEGR